MLASAPVVWAVTANSQLDAVSKSLTEMRRLGAEIPYESDSFLYLFPKSISVACPVAADVDKVEQLYWLCTNLLHTLSTLKYSTAHAAFVHYLRGSLTSIATEQQSFLAMLSDEHTHRVTPERLADHKRRIERCMQDAWRDYGIAREHVYGRREDSTAASTTAKSKPEQSTYHQRKSRRFSLSRLGAAAYAAAAVNAHSPTDGAADAEVTESMRQTDPLLAAAVVHPTSASLYHTTSDVFARSCFFFYVTRYHRALQTIELNPHDPHSAATPAPPQPTNDPQQQPQHHKYRAIRTSFLHHLRHPLSWSLLGFHPLRDFAQLVSGFGEFVRHPSVDLLWLRSSLKIALIISAAALIAIIPYTNTASVCQNHTPRFASDDPPIL